MKSSDLKVVTHADIANIRYCFFCQPGGVPHTLAVSTNWLNVHAGIMYMVLSTGNSKVRTLQQRPLHGMWTRLYKLESYMRRRPDNNNNCSTALIARAKSGLRSNLRASNFPGEAYL